MTLRTIFGSSLLWIGAGLLVLGTGPLIATIVFDPKSNPVGFGMLAFFTFWPSILLMLIGLGLGIARTVRLKGNQPQS